MMVHACQSFISELHRHVELSGVIAYEFSLAAVNVGQCAAASVE
jgi:hypothetical protein